MAACTALKGHRWLLRLQSEAGSPVVDEVR